MDGDDLAQGLQYGDTAGLKPLLDWIWGLQEVSHGRKKNEGWRISIGTGSQDLIFKVRLEQHLIQRYVDECPFVFPVGSECDGESRRFYPRGKSSLCVSGYMTKNYLRRIDSSF